MTTFMDGDVTGLIAQNAVSNHQPVLLLAWRRIGYCPLQSKFVPMRRSRKAPDKPVRRDFRLFQTAPYNETSIDDKRAFYVSPFAWKAPK